MKDPFPQTVSYNRIVEQERKVAIPFVLFVKKYCIGGCAGISSVNNPALRVCRNQRGHFHKVFTGHAPRGHCSKRWFYEFILHQSCNEKGDLLNSMVTPDTVDDREPHRNKSLDRKSVV